MKFGTEVLAYTKFLKVDATRRVRETAQMVMDVMCPHGLEPGGRGVRATMKVRVMHAIVRHMIGHDPHARPNPSDAHLRAQFGVPINQEDMVYTLMTFSYVVVQGFSDMGYAMTREERDLLRREFVAGFLAALHVRDRAGNLLVDGLESGS